MPLVAAWQHSPVADLDRPAVPLTDWMARLRAELGDDPSLVLTADEERLLLELARLAAHTSERIAAPLTTFVAGQAMAGRPPAERVTRLRTLLDRLGGS